uniref:Uncharacterized protein n=1 Tax=Acrobeloides nanus TaxID=290746 RepID=A0A914DDH9_9BILA
MKSEELDAEFERVGKTLEHVLHGMEENFNRMFSGSRTPSRRGGYQKSENVNSTQVESSTQESKTDQEETEQVQTTEKSPEPQKMVPNNEETDAKINEMEKKLAQVLGMVEKLENENGRLKKIVTSMINGT